MLHILLSSPYRLLQSSCLSFSSIKDDLLCAQDGVLLSTMDSIFYEKIDKNFNLIYFLKEDLVARGLLAIAKNKNLILVSYDGFVYLTLGHNNNITW